MPPSTTRSRPATRRDSHCGGCDLEATRQTRGDVGVSYPTSQEPRRGSCQIGNSELMLGMAGRPDLQVVFTLLEWWGMKRFGALSEIPVFISFLGCPCAAHGAAVPSFGSSSKNKAPLGRL